MKLAFLDYVFSWPPLGGAPADLYHTMSGLQQLGHEVHLFFATQSDNLYLDPIEVESLPFESTRVDYTHSAFTPELVAERFRTAVDAWKPDVVFQCFGFFMKPYVSAALSHYPQIARYYAYEPFCPRDYRLYKNHARCPQNYLVTPDECRRCTLKAMWRSMRTGDPSGYVNEYLTTRAHTQGFYDLLADTLQSYKGIIVYNQMSKRLLEGFSDRVHVIGGGVRLEDFHYVPMPVRAMGEKHIILMAGRAEDEAKGMKILQQAGELLRRTRDDFEIWATHSGMSLATEWFKPVGWHRFSVIKQFYEQADICVVPSKWEEPFGLVAVEAMATGRPVVVANVGGLQEIVLHGETGYIYNRERPEELAEHLGRLLSDSALRRRMGEQGRRRVEEHYTWKKVIETHYPPLLESALS